MCDKGFSVLIRTHLTLPVPVTCERNLPLRVNPTSIKGRHRLPLKASKNKEDEIKGDWMKLSVREVSGKPIKLVGRGERMEDLEPFYPDGMAGRVIGMGDVLSFVEKAQEIMKQEDAEELQKKIMSAKFDFNNFLKQTRVVAQMGSMSRGIGMIPGTNKVTSAQIREAEKSLKLMESMIEAMTPEEREKPELLAESPARRKRIVQDTGKFEAYCFLFFFMFQKKKKKTERVDYLLPVLLFYAESDQIWFE